MNIAESWIHSIFGLVEWNIAMRRSSGVIFGLGPLCSVANMRFICHLSPRSPLLGIGPGSVPREKWIK